MLAALDSHFKAVEANIIAYNPTRQVIGMSEAQDWPAEDVIFEAFYCLVLGAMPLGKQAYSAVSPIVTHELQWVWIIMGTDVQAGIRGRNRGDRYRTNHTMEQELLAGLYPYYTQKLNWSVDGNGNVQSTVPSPADSILWTPARFVTRVDKESGLIYSSASTSVTEITEAVAA